MYIVIIAVIAAAAIIVGLKSGGYFSPQRAAGRYGERVATERIKRILRPNDRLFTNVKLSFEGRRAEFDNIIVNEYGVHIIEVKNYSGRLFGSENEQCWQKYHTSRGGKTYVKTVKNPIRQVHRQINILAEYLKSRSVSVWVSGYVLLLNDNSPVNSRSVLHNISDADRALHTRQKSMLSERRIERICSLLSREK